MENPRILKVLQITASVFAGVFVLRWFGVVGVLAEVTLMGEWHSHDGQSGMGGGLIAMALSPFVAAAVAWGFYRLMAKKL